MLPRFCQEAAGVAPESASKACERTSTLVELTLAGPVFMGIVACCTVNVLLDLAFH